MTEPSSTALQKLGPRLGAAALVVTALLTAGCQAFKTLTPEETVSNRSTARWSALIAGDFPKAYAYLQPGYRAVIDEKSYAKSFGNAGSWEKVDLYETVCEPESCTVTLRLTTKNLVPRFAAAFPYLSGFIKETWIKEDNQWWYYQKLGQAAASTPNTAPTAAPLAAPAVPPSKGAK